MGRRKKSKKPPVSQTIHLPILFDMAAIILLHMQFSYASKFLGSETLIVHQAYNLDAETYLSRIVKWAVLKLIIDRVSSKDSAWLKISS